MVVRMVPISAEQVRICESIERAFFGLAADFRRDVADTDDDSLEGGLYRLWSCLNVIATMWKEDAPDQADVERWRRALARIRDHDAGAWDLDGAGGWEAYEQVKRLAREALGPGEGLPPA